MDFISTRIFLLIISLVVYTENQKIGEICKIKNSDRQGICKPLGECPYALTIKKRGGNFPDCGHENRVTLACCPPDFQAPPVAPRRVKTVSEMKCSEYTSAVYYKTNTSYISLSLNSKSQNAQGNGCGMDNTPLIIGGKNAKPREFPHMALVGINNGSNQHPDWFCGGSLISHHFVLTAAHCFIKNPNIVRLGDLDYYSTEDEASPEDYSIIQSIQHKDYRFPSKHHDIALLKLNRKVEFNIYRRPACLPTSSTITDKVATASGWGLTEAYEDNSKSSMLLKVVLNLFNQSECIDIYSRQEIPIIGNQFCAGSKTERKDTCQGDSGGPLQIIHEDEYCIYKIIGITSFGSACGALEPAVYTKVYPYLSWIELIVWNTSPDRIIFPQD